MPTSQWFENCLVMALSYNVLTVADDITVFLQMKRRGELVRWPVLWWVCTLHDIEYQSMTSSNFRFCISVFSWPYFSITWWKPSHTKFYMSRFMRARDMTAWIPDFHQIWVVCFVLFIFSSCPTDDSKCWNVKKKKKKFFCDVITSVLYNWALWRHRHK